MMAKGSPKAYGSDCGAGSAAFCKHHPGVCAACREASEAGRYRTDSADRADKPQTVWGVLDGGSSPRLFTTREVAIEYVLKQIEERRVQAMGQEHTLFDWYSKPSPYCKDGLRYIQVYKLKHPVDGRDTIESEMYEIREMSLHTTADVP